ncbi:triphosphoribosyl-dephospho-CoA synthase [Streptomyces sp. Ac-502]|uniref:triphosphoribosyl-dephospho-CoA synthase n=1 Tax=Streptomyces sp. Ac-502 TaxID=3342801 RepID=UPI0038623EE7
MGKHLACARSVGGSDENRGGADDRRCGAPGGWHGGADRTYQGAERRPGERSRTLLGGIRRAWRNTEGARTDGYSYFFSPFRGPRQVDHEEATAGHRAPRRAAVARAPRPAHGSAPLPGPPPPPAARRPRRRRLYGTDGAGPEAGPARVARRRAVARPFASMAEAAMGRPLDRRLREQLGRLGRAGEQRALEAGAGAPGKRGALWSVGLLVAGAAATNCRSDVETCEAAATLARLPDGGAPAASRSPGGRARQYYGVPGAVGQARSGFPNVLGVALPALRQSRAAGASEVTARMDALLALLSTLDDTTLLQRGGSQGLLSVQMDARDVLSSGGFGTARGRKAFVRLDARMTRNGLTAGGSAALLSAALFLDFLFEGR